MPKLNPRDITWFETNTNSFIYNTHMYFHIHNMYPHHTTLSNPLQIVFGELHLYVCPVNCCLQCGLGQSKPNELECVFCRGYVSVVLASPNPKMTFADNIVTCILHTHHPCSDSL